MARSIARLLVGVMVFAQVVVAAYACPAMPASPLSAEAEHAAVMGDGMALASRVDAMPAGWRMDPAQPNLCAAHCQAGQQNADAKPAPTLPCALPANSYLVVQSTLPARPALALAAVDRPPPAAPPLAILHCCFRI